MNLLLLNVGRRGELAAAFRRAMLARGGGLLIGSDIDPLAPACHFCDLARLLPRTDEPDFLAALAALHAKTPIDLLIPTIDPDLERLDHLRDTIECACPGMQLLLSPSFTIAYCRDKRRSRALFAELGAEVPRAISPEELADALPIFAKPPNGSGSRGAGIVSSHLELRLRLWQEPELMLEAVVDGPEITVDILCDLTGEPLVAIPRQRLQVRDGEVSRAVVERDADLESLAMRLARGFRCRGPVTMQFRRPAPGRYVAMELNARLGGGVPLSIAAGADWAGWILDLAAGRRPALHGGIRDGLVMSRLDQSVFIPPASAPRPAPSPLAIEALICDMDDTLYLERDFVFSGYRAVAAHIWHCHGIDIEGELRSRFDAGQRGDLFTPTLLAHGLPASAADIQRLVEIYRRHQPRIQPCVDTAVLAHLRAAGLRLGLLSDGWHAVQRAKLEALGLRELFEVVIFTDEIGGPRCWKPHPAGFEAALRRLQLPADRVAYIGDNPGKDFEAPYRLGMASIRIRRLQGLHAHLPTSPETPCREISSLAQLTSMLTFSSAVRDPKLQVTP